MKDLKKMNSEELREFSNQAFEEYRKRTTISPDDVLFLDGSKGKFKKIPEVGDIWKDREGRKMFLFQETDRYLHFLRRKAGYPAHRQIVVTVTYVRSSFNQLDFEYVGEAKHNVNDLFEEQDNE